jgi:hypothetical protein
VKHKVTTGNGFRPASVGHEIGGGERERLSRFGAACGEHGAYAGFTLERTHSRPHAIARVQELQDAVCADESRAARNQHQLVTHAGLPVCAPIE